MEAFGRESSYVLLMASGDSAEVKYKLDQAKSHIARLICPPSNGMDEFKKWQLQEVAVNRGAISQAFRGLHIDAGQIAKNSQLGSTAKFAVVNGVVRRNVKFHTTELT